jgi:lysozyme
MIYETSTDGIDFIKSFESCRLTAYLDQKGIPTIGWGRTLGVKLGDTCTQQQADAWLMEDIHEAEAVVNRFAHSRRWNLNQQQFNALVSLVYNIGQGNFKTSTVQRKLTEGNYQAAADAFLMWDKVKIHGDYVVSKGLKRRRQAERKTFLS